MSPAPVPQRPVYVMGLGTDVPRPRPVTDPPISGMGITSIACAELPAHELAARAGLRALEAAGTDALEVDRLLYASSFDPTPALWPPASYVADRLGIQGPALRVDQVSNSGMAALQLAVDLLAGPGAETVLIATGERHADPAIDRWHSDPGTVYGDGGAAAVVGHEGGRARIHAVQTVSDPWLEGMHRPENADPTTSRVDLGDHKRRFIREHGSAETLRRLAHGQRAAVDWTLKHAGVALTDVDWFVIPHLGLRRLRSALLGPFDIPLERTTWEWGHAVGHLGPGDQLFGLERLLGGARTKSGDLVLMIGIGSGFSWTCALLEV